MPRFAVGIVIGRNGEMIKKIQNDAGVRIQFKPGLCEDGELLFPYQCSTLGSLR